MNPPVRGALLVGLLAVAAARPATGQASRADSARVLRAARSEQSRFEAIRRNHLPWAWGGGSGPCDERIGRFCLTHGDKDEKEWVAPPEPKEIAVGRERLLERLATAAAAIPGDRWVTGQRVRYLVEARRFQEARAAAGECRVPGWWCAALRGFAEHSGGAAARADSAFTEMLEAMPVRERERWLDPSLVMEPDLLKRFRGMPGPRRAEFQRRFWRLADPFLSRPGNDIRSEHLSRNLMDELQDRAESADHLSWGSDLREILVRYGWPSGWERVRESGLHQSAPSLVSHYANTEQHLLPPSALFADTASIAAGEWDEEAPRARAGYALPLADSTLRWIYPLEHQLAVFRRGDSAVVVAAYALPADSLPAGARVDAALAISRDGSGADLLTRRDSASTTGALSATVRPDRLLVSLELVAERARRAARARTGLSLSPLPSDRMAVSDLLLLRDGPSLPETLETAMDQARGTTTLKPGEQVGVYWEVYGSPAGPTGELGMSLRLREREPGWMRRLGERTGIVRATEPVQMQWREPARSGDFLTRALFILIPPLRPGQYVIELAITSAGAEPLSAQQEIRIVQ